MAKKKKPTLAQMTAWRVARMRSYASRSPETLAWMLVDLEDSTESLPEFEIDEAWPSSVESLRVR